MNLLEQSINTIKKYQTTYGSYIASPSFSQYLYCWFRDGSFIADAMNLVGENKSAKSFFDWGMRVISSQEERISKIVDRREEITQEELLPTRYLLDGRLTLDEWPNAQSDGYGTFLWALARCPDREFIEEHRDSIELITHYLEKVWKIPCFDVWEESEEAIHTSTLLSIAAGLKASETVLGIKTVWREVVDFILRRLTANGRFVKSTSNFGVDSSLCWASAPFGLFDNENPLVINTVEEIERTLVFDGGAKRYIQDTYYGGGSWILLSAYLAQWYAGTGQIEKARAVMSWIESNANQNGELPEQVPEHLLDEEMYRPWVERWGNIACPLLWSHAGYISLSKELSRKS